jgi:phosphohistidine phosphatase
MVRRLFLMRHGKAAWPEGLPDHARPLAPQGAAFVPKIAEKLNALAGTLDCVLVSDARRTRETFACLATVIPDLEPRFLPEIYEARPGVLLDLVQALPIFARNVLMVGHNPGLQALALYLAHPRTSEPDALHRLERKLPTAGLIHLELPVPWDEIDSGWARLAHFITPGMIGGIDED